MMATPAAMPRRLPLVGVLALCVALGGCERFMRDMYDQPKLKTGATTPLFADGLASRPPPPGAEAYSSGEAAADSSGRRGAAAVRALDAADAAQSPPANDAAATLARGQARYDDLLRALPRRARRRRRPGRAARLSGAASARAGAPARGARPPFLRRRHHGYGVMRPYADRVDASDRWAIVAAVRRLQADAAGARAGTASMAASAPASAQRP